jgi:hypothetical protein
MSAYELGWTAAEHGLTIKSNPFMRGTGEEISWRWGFRAMLDSVGL